MESLFQRSDLLLQRTPADFSREVPGNPNWDWKMNAVIGARGVGKTTLLLQRLQQISKAGKNGLYVTLDDPYFTQEAAFSLVAENRCTIQPI